MVGAGLGLQSIDQINDIAEAAATAIADRGSDNGYGQTGFTGVGATDRGDIALIGNEGSASGTG